MHFTEFVIRRWILEQERLKALQAPWTISRNGTALAKGRATREDIGEICKGVTDAKFKMPTDRELEKIRLAAYKQRAISYRKKLSKPKKKKMVVEICASEAKETLPKQATIKT